MLCENFVKRNMNLSSNFSKCDNNNASTLVSIYNENKRQKCIGSKNVIIEITKKFRGILTNVYEYYYDIGVSTFYYNLSLGTKEENTKIIQLINDATDNQATIILGISGRLPIIGQLCTKQTGKCYLKPEHQFILTADRTFATRCTRRAAYSNCYDFLSLTKPGNIIKIGRRIQLFVVQVIDVSIVCRVKKGGQLLSYDRVHFPDERIDIDLDITTEEYDDITFAFAKQIYLLSVPNPRGIDYVNSIRFVVNILRGRYVLLLTHLSSLLSMESETYVENICQLYDGYFYRFINDKPMCCFTEIEKYFFKLCNKYKKPLSIVIESNEKLRKLHETSVFEYLHYYVDTFLLENLNLNQMNVKNFVQNNMNQSASSMNFNHLLKYPGQSDYSGFLFSCSMLVHQINASAILICTHSGRAPITLSNYRPNCLIIALVMCPIIPAKLELYSNLKVIDMETVSLRKTKQWKKYRDDMLELGIEISQKKKWLLKDDVVILLYQSKCGLGNCNEMKIIKI